MAKYDSMRKLERNRLLVEYRGKHPELSLDEIGSVFNISRERVRQILKSSKNNHSTEQKPVE